MTLTLSSWSLILSLLLPIVPAILYALRVHRQYPDITVETAHQFAKPVIWITLIVALLVIVPALAEISDRFCQQLPLWFQRFNVAILCSLLMALISFLIAFLFTLASRTRHPKRRQIYLMTVLLNLGIFTIGWKNTFEISGRLEHEHTYDGVVLQSEGASCAAATVANLLRFHAGKVVSEREVARVMGTTAEGTSPGQIRYTLHHYAVNYHVLNERTKNLREVHPPAILFVDHPAVGTEGHAVLYVGSTNTHFEILDPLEGRTRWSPHEVHQRWHGNGIECSR